MKTYKGWTITYEPARPATGTWRAERFGVGMCNNSESALLRMIDRKERDAVRAFRKAATDRSVTK